MTDGKPSRAISAAIVAWCAVALASCSDPCSELDGASFASLNTYECGLGPDGIFPCHWTIAFHDADFSWVYSDVMEDGRYSCHDGAITGQAWGATYGGQYDSDSEILTWVGVQYARQ
jgi:hypothetical protein